MKTYYEKRSVEKDGLPENDGYYITFQDSKANTREVYFGEGQWHPTLADNEVTHYLVPVSERAVEERAIAEWDIDFHGHFKARLHLENGQLTVIAAMNGYGDGEDVSKIIVSPLSATTK